MGSFNMTDSPMKPSARGMVLEIQRMSTEDGPGLRTTVFLKGCPLACDWCHNPESISPKPQLVWQGTGCIGCGICIETCENNALSLTPGGVVINRDLCQGCGHCADQCPSLSITLLGVTWTAQDLVKELAKDRAYFQSSRGGVTLSGGEATLQHEFSLEVLKGLQAQGIHTALDTCGMTAISILEKLLGHTDLLLFDIKEMDETRHKSFTGASNAIILENLMQLPGLLKKHPTELWIRTPIIPGATDRDDNIRSMGSFIALHLKDTVCRWELCAFNTLGKDKYTRLGKTWAHETTLPMEKRRMDNLVETALESGLDRAIVVHTGATRPISP
ncbi:MAG: glycyl-radical enzyme activating protein [Desulfobacterium sp.]|nr:glycyl-radical enzyme activating protein [Desulfobacterium sp.]